MTLKNGKFKQKLTLAFQIVPRVGEMAGDLSDPEDEDPSAELDRAVPRHQLLDNSAAKYKTELVHRGAARHRPTHDKLKELALRRSQSILSSASGSSFQTVCLNKIVIWGFKIW